MKYPVWRKHVHRYLDPLIALPNHFAEHYALRRFHLSDGDYHARVPFDIPYVSQFASPEKIYDYIHQGYDGTTDPNWQIFGAEKKEDYAFWTPRVCALAVLKMSIQAFTGDSPTLWELVQRGLSYNGYRVYGESGELIDEGWYVEAQTRLAADYGLKMRGYSYVSSTGICRHLLEGRLVLATVSPEIGERIPHSRRYGGHAVLVIGFRWQKGRPTHFIAHNPSGRYAELQARAILSMKRFQQHFAHRYATLEKS